MKTGNLVFGAATGAIGFILGALLVNHIFQDGLRHQHVHLDQLNMAMGTLHGNDDTPRTPDHIREILAWHAASSLFLATTDQYRKTDANYVERLDRAIMKMDSRQITSLVKQRDIAERADRIIECWRRHEDAQSAFRECAP